MPLKPGKSDKVVGKNIAEFHKGKTYAQTAAKHGKDVANRQAVAVAMKEAGRSRNMATAEDPEQETADALTTWNKKNMALRCRKKG